ncbi:LNS2-domain-containing protein [Hymenopellis radicata]|nr:LNS2-domain-containing protein [Hymenopellis radicata]
MNYLRGAVNAISAPYQYYKELPPINPSTLTGAIDVIVIQRPADNGGTELACSPFHVRFGKWQVLRPSEKKVTVLVNGHPIPFNMKIGEAGEAFFVFETDDDVPDDLITSPLLQATEDNEEAKTDKVEPDFLDLDASSDVKQKQQEPQGQISQTPKEEDPAERELNERADQALRNVGHHVEHTPNVEYTDQVAYDIEGYHAPHHDRERSDRTIRSTDEFAFPRMQSEPLNEEQVPFPSSSRPPSPPRTPSPPLKSSRTPSTSSSRSRPSSPGPTFTFPSMRATSEPPPDHEVEQVAPPLSLPKLNVGPPAQEYSWEWGAFPQPSPMKATFGKGGRIEDNTVTWSKGKSKSIGNRLEAVEESEGRSRSVPPTTRGKGKERQTFPSVEVGQEGQALDQETHYGAGGRLSVSPSDPTKFRVSIEGRRIDFELSLISDEEDRRGRRTRGEQGSKDRLDDFEFARRFEEGKVDLNKLLEDDDLVHDPSLVLKWSEGQYIRASDESPLMPALRIWRSSYLEMRDAGIVTRPSSPLSDDEDGAKSGGEELEDKDKLIPGKSETRKPPTSSSWVQWWSRSRRDNAKKAKTDRPALKESVSAPLEDETKDTPHRPPQLKDFPPADSAPALPSTPIQKPVEVPPSINTAVVPGKKFAKTLRLTSDQLKALNLKPGSNTITFSLSMTGAIVCTARIFVWDSTDLVLVSDIDGTITKSDALGHVFAMVGRDWTHLGVAKLYTDICRNGYKIMYLTSRAIGQADATRDYLKNIKQNDYQLPEGPVIMSPDRLMASLHREVIMRKPEVFKMACLRDIQRLFGDASRNPFYAGFGNRITDALSYRSVNVPSSRIFTIDSTGEVKLELLELAGYKSSYIHMTDLVDQMFPPIHRKWTPEFTDFNYWKAPIHEYPLPDLSPPSPALSARSDTSNASGLARLRNFSLLGGRQANNLPKSTSPTPRETSPEGEPARSPELRQMSSFERLSSTLGFSGSSSSTIGRRSASPDSISSSSLTYAESESDDEVEDDGAGRRKKRERTRSMSSIPGALDDMHFEIDERDEDDHNEYDGEEEEDEEAAEEDFDEDLLAAGEMKNVPFL